MNTMKYIPIACIIALTGQAANAEQKITISKSLGDGYSEDFQGGTEFELDSFELKYSIDIDENLRFVAGVQTGGLSENIEGSFLFHKKYGIMEYGIYLGIGRNTDYKYVQTSRPDTNFPGLIVPDESLFCDCLDESLLVIRPVISVEMSDYATAYVEVDALNVARSKPHHLQVGFNFDVGSSIDIGIAAYKDVRNMLYKQSGSQNPYISDIRHNIRFKDMGYKFSLAYAF